MKRLLMRALGIGWVVTGVSHKGRLYTARMQKLRPLGLKSKKNSRQRFLGGCPYSPGDTVRKG